MPPDLLSDVACFPGPVLSKLWHEHSGFSGGQSEPWTIDTSPSKPIDWQCTHSSCNEAPEKLFFSLPFSSSPSSSFPSSSSFSSSSSPPPPPPSPSSFFPLPFFFFFVFFFSCFYMVLYLLPKQVTDRTLFNTPKSVVSWLIDFHFVS